MRLILVAPAAVAMLALPAMAQTTTTSPSRAPSATAPSATSPSTTAPAGQYQKLVDMHVVGTDGKKIGEVDNVFIDQAGRIAGLIIDVGGFLGVAKKEVMMDVSQLRHEGGRLVTNMTGDQIKTLPEWSGKR